MRAWPYDLTRFGPRVGRRRDARGRAECVGHQRGFTDGAQVLRWRLFIVLDSLGEVTTAAS